MDYLYLLHENVNVNVSTNNRENLLSWEFEQGLQINSHITFVILRIFTVLNISF
jgi:hypothetical protein